MLHACFTPIALSFTTTLWHFYTISDTNLLTRCRGASSLFSAVFGFRKVTQEIFSELDETKAETPIFPGTFQSTKEALQPDQEVVSPPLGAARVWPRQGQVWAPSWPPDAVLSPIYCLRTKSYEMEIRNPRKVLPPPSSSTLDREGSGALPGTLPEGEIIAGGLFITMPASGMTREYSTNGLRVHGSS